MSAPDTRPFMALRMGVDCGDAVGKAVYLAIAARAEGNKDLIAWPSLELIAHDAQCDERTALRKTVELERLGCFKRIVGTGRRPTTYQLLDDAPSTRKLERRTRCADSLPAQTNDADSRCADSVTPFVRTLCPPKDVPVKTAGADPLGPSVPGVAGSTQKRSPDRPPVAAPPAASDGRGEEDDATRRRNVKAAIDRADVAERRMVAAVPAAPTTNGAGYGVASPRIVQDGGLVIGAATPHGTQPVTRDPSECEHLGGKLADHDGAVTCCACGGVVRAAPVAVSTTTVIEEASRQKVLEDEADAPPRFRNPKQWEMWVAPPRRPRVARFADGRVRVPFGEAAQWETFDVPAA